jgi:hypothetical protein
MGCGTVQVAGEFEGVRGQKEKTVEAFPDL